MITLRNIEKVYPLKGGVFYALRNINLTINEGDFVSIMGNSGSGKSTLLHILGLHDSAWQGEYTCRARPSISWTKRNASSCRKNTSVSCSRVTTCSMTSRYTRTSRFPFPTATCRKKERESVVCDVLDRFGIVGKKDLFPNQLSGGQQQLVGVARALIAKPSLLLADEPTGNLHSDQGREIMKLFKKLNEEGTTIIQVTHSAENATYGSRVIRLADGMMVP